jgi:hypothetical protein
LGVIGKALEFQSNERMTASSSNAAADEWSRRGPSASELELTHDTGAIAEVTMDKAFSPMTKPANAEQPEEELAETRER